MHLRKKTLSCVSSPVLSVIVVVNIIHWSYALSPTYQSLPAENISASALTSLQLCKSCGSEPGQMQTSRYIWDRKTLKADQYQRLFCGRTCAGDRLRDRATSFLCPGMQCFDCICERPKCEIYGICCPLEPTETHASDFNTMVLERNNSQRNGTKDSSTKEKNTKTNDLTDAAELLDLPVLQCESLGRSDGYLYVQSCPRHYNDSDARKLCEEDYDPEKNTTLEQFARVSDSVTKTVYRNNYCALCNGVKEPIRWKVKVECAHFMFVYAALTFDQLLTTSLQAASSCRVRQKPLAEHLTPCRPLWFRDAPVSNCNVTGLWREYSGDVEKACHELGERSFSIFFNTHHSSLRPYQNIFCAICNMRDYPNCHSSFGVFTTATGILGNPLNTPNQGGPWNPVGDILLTGSKAHIPEPPFSVLLGFRQSNPVYKPLLTFHSCGTGKWSSPDGSCMETRCAQGKALNNGTCATALEQIRGLGYRFDVWFEPDISWSSNDLSAGLFVWSTINATEASIEETVSIALNGSADGYHIQVTMVVPHENLIKSGGGNKSTTLRSNVALFTSLLITASEAFTRDEFEDQMLLFVKRFLRDGITATVAGSSLEAKLVPRLALRDGRADPDTQCSNPGTTCYSTDRFVYWKRSSVFKARDYFLQAKMLLRCPYVQFGKSRYTIKQSDSPGLLTQTVVAMRFGDSTLLFSKPDELHQMAIDESGALSVCQDMLASKLAQAEEERRQKFYNRTLTSGYGGVKKAQYYLTLACLSASMACLVFTLVTYFSFKVLRNTAGINNIILCGSLFLAQASLLASAHVNGPASLCTVLGMLTHFLWLWMFAWSFICCFHMFRVFTARSRRKLPQCCWTPRLALTLTVSLTGPAGVVGLVVATSLFTTKGRRTGYGHDVCYLDSPLLVGLSTALPLLLVTMANIVFFALSTASIYSVRALQSPGVLKKNESRIFLIYVKLSSLTGAFWLIQILAETLDVDVLRFLAIVANGLQGVFIFLSYICNKRVLSLYRQHFRRKPVTLTTSDTLRRVVTDGSNQCSSGKVMNSMDSDSSTLETGCSSGKVMNSMDSDSSTLETGCSSGKVMNSMDSDSSTLQTGCSSGKVVNSMDSDSSTLETGCSSGKVMNSMGSDIRSSTPETGQAKANGKEQETKGVEKAGNPPIVQAVDWSTDRLFNLEPSSAHSGQVISEDSTVLV